MDWGCSVTVDNGDGAIFRKGGCPSHNLMVDYVDYNFLFPPTRSMYGRSSNNDVRVRVVLFLLSQPRI